MPEPGLELLGWSKAQIEAIAEGVGDITGLSPKQSVARATVAALPTNTYANGSSGVGATLTGTIFGELEVDGAAVIVGQRVLVKNEAEEKKNGIYSVTKAGGLAENYVLTRTTDLDKTGQFDGAYTLVETGSSEHELAGSGWVVASDTVITVGTTAVVWTEFGSRVPASVVNGSEGEEVGATGLALNAYHLQMEGEKPIALYIGRGTGKEPRRLDLTGTPAEGSVTLAKLAAEVLTKIENNNSLYKIPRVPSGNRIAPPFSSATSATLGTKEVLLLFPIDIAVKTITKAIEIYVEEAGEGSGQQVRLGVYADDGTGTKPTGSPLWDAGAIATLTTGEKVIEAEKIWEPGRYWVGLVLQGALTKNPKFKTGNYIAQTLGFAAWANPGTVGLKQEGAGSGALPTIGSLVPSTLSSPIIALRVK